jgi:uncharacterized protein YeaO (DUF488 family)
MVKIKRAYDPVEPVDGRRILVDRLWPRGVTRDSARIDKWLKELAPSTELRKWFGHEPEKWTEFKERYRQELGNQAGLLEKITGEARQGTVTLVYGAKDRNHNNAVVLNELLYEKIAGKT